MSKRAALIITTEPSIGLVLSPLDNTCPVPTSEQLLADLREAVNACEVIAVLRHDEYWHGVAARVRALLREEDEDA